MKEKYNINATDEQIENLVKAFAIGSPLTIALNYSGISKVTFYYWVALSCIVKSFQEIDYTQIQKTVVDDETLEQVKNKTFEDNQSQTGFKGSIDAWIEPTEKNLTLYRNNRDFRDFCKKAHAIISRCDKARSDAVLVHLDALRKSAQSEGKFANKNTSASQWFLERVMPNFFGRPVDNIETPTETEMKPISLVVVNSNNDKIENERIKKIEEEVVKGMKEDA